MEILLPILAAVGLLGGIGLVCGVVLAVAEKACAVPVDEKREALRGCLPGVNCGACGYTGCDGYAEALANGGTDAVNLCVPGGDDVSRAIAGVLGVEATDVVEHVAYVQCHGDCELATRKFEYEGIGSCAAANMLYGGEWDCTYGCLGHGDCAKVCPTGAICLENGIAHVDPRRCIGCGLCAKTCPKHIITLFPDVKRVVVTCSSHDAGAATRKKCKNGCIACRKCEKSCPTGAVTVQDDLAVIDYDKCINCGACADACPVHCIKYADFSGKHRQGDEG